MAISVRCSECAKKYTVKDEAAGKSFKCKDCGTTLAVPAAKPRPDEDEFEDYEEASFDEATVASRRSKKSSGGSRGRTTKKKSSKSSSGGRIVFIGGAVLGVIVLLAGLGIAVSKLGGASWVEYSHPDGTFKIKFPKQPKVQALGHGAELSHNITCETSSGACIVEYADLTAVLRQSGQSLSDPGMSDVFLEGVVTEAAVKRGIKQPLQATPITFRGFPGREVQIQMKGLSNTMRLYLCGTGFYSLQYVRKQDTPRPADMDRFFDSFDPSAGRGAVTTGASNAMATTTTSAPLGNPNDPYLKRRAAFQTKLVKQGPAPQEWKPEVPPVGVKEVLYPSGQMQLKAWVTEPLGASGAKQPAVVYFHGGFAFGGDDFQACDPFRKLGFAVMTPMLRGENGNPGHHELFWGEIDDAKAAVQWLAKQPHIDAKRIYAFGHSAGGGIASLLALQDDVPLRHTGSAGGLYSEDVFFNWGADIPFDVSNPEERNLRVLVGHLRDTKRSHVAYFGVSDSALKPSVEKVNAEKMKLGVGAPISKTNVWTLFVSGDHFTCLNNALLNYARLCEMDSRQIVAGISSDPPALETHMGAVLTEEANERAEQLEKTASTSRSPALDYKEAANAWLGVGNFERALAAAKKAESAGLKAGQEFLAHFWHRGLADVFLKAGDPKSAIPHYEKAIEKTDIKGYIAECEKSLVEAKAKAGE